MESRYRHFHALTCITENAANRTIQARTIQKGWIMESNSNHSPATRAETWIALALCAAVLLGRVIEHFVSPRPAHAQSLSPEWLPLAAAAFAAAGIMRLEVWPPWLRIRPALQWSGLLLMVWVANGLPFDWLTIAG